MEALVGRTILPPLKCRCIFVQGPLGFQVLCSPLIFASVPSPISHFIFLFKICFRYSSSTAFPQKFVNKQPCISCLSFCKYRSLAARPESDSSLALAWELHGPAGEGQSGPKACAPVVHRDSNTSMTRKPFQTPKSHVLSNPWRWGYGRDFNS